MEMSYSTGSFSSTVDSFVASSSDDTASSIPEDEKGMEATSAAGNENTETKQTDPYFLPDLVTELARKLAVEKQERVESELRLYQLLAEERQARHELEQRLSQQFEQMMEMFHSHRPNHVTTARPSTPRPTPRPFSSHDGSQYSSSAAHNNLFASSLQDGWVYLPS